MKRALLLTIGLSLMAPLALAQDNQESEEDVVVATGQKQNDPAMRAFLSGDYATAEIEFDKNAFCALRAQRLFEGARDDARESALRSEFNATAGIGQATGPNGETVGQNSAQAPNINTNRLNRSENSEKSTCIQRGYQTYMKGMSQLKLGKREEARKTLASATRIQRTLWDAHFRLALMAYQDGDLDEARKESRKLRSIAKRCRDCMNKQMIEEQVAYLSNLLN